MIVRLYYAVSFEVPLQGITTGAEAQSLNAFWRYIQGETIYREIHKIPYAAPVYNWLYFAFYGTIAGHLLDVMSLEDQWLPTVARLITLTGIICGTVLTYHFFIRLFKVNEPELKRLCFAFSLSLFFGPLVGFFGIAAAPDIWALVFDVSATYLFFRYYQKQSFAIVLVCFFAYLAWAFKQIFVYTPGTIGLFLLLKRDWKNIFLLCLLLGGAWLATMAIGGRLYIHNILFLGTTNDYLVAVFIRNVLKFFEKSTPGLIGLLTIGSFLVFRPKLTLEMFMQPSIRFAFLGIFVSACISLPTSAKAGAAENYYFTLSFFILFAVLATMIWLLRHHPAPEIPLAGLGVGWILNGVAVLSVLLGINGVLSVRSYHENLMEAKSCIKDLPKPIFAEHIYLSLEWMNPAENHFVLGYNYFTDRRAGIKFERGGINGLIRERYFGSLLLKKQNGWFDSADYSRIAKPCGEFQVYVRGSD
ncbi:MAG: hypothetical protein HQM14_18445 [SAR324 cluster bacterium]|nr:hypothetical protein [SAR324 cluster bacterium]